MEQSTNDQEQNQKVVKRPLEEHDNDSGKDKKSRKLIKKNLGEKVFVTTGNNAFHLATIVLDVDPEVDEATGEKLIMIEWDSTRRNALVLESSIQKITNNFNSERRKSTRNPPPKEAESNKKNSSSMNGHGNPSNKHAKKNGRLSASASKGNLDRKNTRDITSRSISNHKSAVNHNSNNGNCSFTKAPENDDTHRIIQEAAKNALTVLKQRELSLEAVEPGGDENQSSSKLDAKYSSSRIPKIVSWPVNHTQPDEAPSSSRDSKTSMVEKSCKTGQEVNSLASMMSVGNERVVRMCKRKRRRLCIRPFESLPNHAIQTQWNNPKALAITARDDRIYYICGFSLFYGRYKNCKHLYHYGSMVKLGDGSNEVEYDIVYLTKDQISDGLRDSAFVQLDTRELPSDPGFVYHSI